MDTSKLKEGMVVKSYKAMCEVLGDDYFSGKSKQNQLDNWARYFKWHKEGNSFIIEKIYEEVKSKTEIINSKEIHTINIYNLQIGMVVKNYKEMCELLGQSQKSRGNSRNGQFDDWRQYFSWHKDGHKFIIDSIYDKPKRKIDAREQGNNTIYSEDIQNILLQVLYNNPTEYICWSCTELLKQLSMVNSEYGCQRGNVPNLSAKINIEEDFIYDFYNSTQKSLKQKIETALNTLRRKSLASWTTVIMICKEYIEFETNKHGEPTLVNGEPIYSKVKKYRKATEEEIKSILIAERDTFLSMGYRDKQDVFLSGQWRVFKNKVNEMLTREDNIAFYYNAYEIIYNNEHVKNEFEDIISTREKLNKNISQGLYNSAETRHVNSMKKATTSEGKATPAIEKLRANFSYVKNNKELINHLIATSSNSQLK